MSRQKGKPHFSVFDAVLIVFLIACIAAVGFGYEFKKQEGVAEIDQETAEEYMISFESYNVEQYHAQLLKEGDMYYLSDNAEFGTLNGKLIMTPALVYAEKDDGTYIRSYAPENGDQTKLDLSGAVMTKGTRNSRGILVIGNGFEAVPGESFIIHNSTVSIRVTITSIDKVSK